MMSALMVKHQAFAVMGKIALSPSILECLLCLFLHLLSKLLLKVVCPSVKVNTPKDVIKLKILEPWILLLLDKNLRWKTQNGCTKKSQSRRAKV
jgi:hypothetical protein